MTTGILNKQKIELKQAAAQSIFDGLYRRLYLGLTMLVMMVLVFSLDSSWVASRFEYGQWLANLFTGVYFIWLYRNANNRIKRTMRYAVVIAAAGEIFLSIMLGMYEYRLGNVPIYVPLGHAILYTTVWYITHDPWVVKKQKSIMAILLGFTLAYTALLWYFDNDVYGAICTGILLFLLAINPKSRRFFLIMFLAVAFLEQVGTFFDCWHWHSTLLNKPGWISSGNPPSGISLGYFILDILCLGVYLLFNLKTSKRWLRRSRKQLS